MKNRLAVVLKYVDGNETLEMQCIYALQALCVKHQYPQGKIMEITGILFCNLRWERFDLHSGLTTL